MKGRHEGKRRKRRLMQDLKAAALWTHRVEALACQLQHSQNHCSQFALLTLKAVSFGLTDCLVFVYPRHYMLDSAFTLTHTTCFNSLSKEKVFSYFGFEKDDRLLPVCLRPNFSRFVPLSYCCFIRTQATAGDLSCSEVVAGNCSHLAWAAVELLAQTKPQERESL